MREDSPVQPEVGRVSGAEDGLTRRVAIARFGALAALATIPAGVSRARAAHAAAAPPAGFTSERQKTFLAFIATYDGQPGSIVDTKGRDILQDAKVLYDQQTRAARDFVDATLDALEVAPPSGPFSELSVGQRRDELSRWYATVDPSDEKKAGRPRPSDAKVRTLDESNTAVGAAIREYTRTLPSDAWELDPVTLLPKFAPPPDPSFRPPALDPPSETVTLRRLRATVFGFVARLVTSDPHVVDNARLS